MLFSAVFETGMIFMIVSTIIVFIALIWWVAQRIRKNKNSEYQKRKRIFEDQKSIKEQHST